MVTPKDNKIVAIAGQPNTGKSTLFNQLTGSNQHVGNWPGKTVEQKTGSFQHKDRQYTVVDLPGTYSLSANSPEEAIARDFIVEASPSVTVVVVDASQLSRSLFMALEVLSLGVSTVIALNMMDVAKQGGLSVDAVCLEKKLGVPVIPLTASKGKGMEDLLDAVAEMPNQMMLEKWRPEKYDKHGGKQDILAVASSRYDCIGKIVKKCTTRQTKKAPRLRSRLDALATHPLWGLILSVVILCFFFFLAVVIVFTAFAATRPLAVEAGHFVDTVIAGPFPIIASLLSQGFIPALYMIFTLSLFILSELLFIGLLEDIGYMPRLACVADPLMARIGLHGKSLMPLILGLGCNIASVMGCRVIDTHRQRYKTLILSSHMPCQGLLASMGFMVALFFGAHFPAIATALVAALILQFVLTSYLLDHTVLKGEESGMIIELPPYHKPNLKTIYRFVQIHFLGFLRRAGTMVIAMVVVLWALTYFPNGNMYDSYLATAGRYFEPLGSLMGMDWRLFTCLFVATFSKESALIALAVMFQLQQGDSSMMGLLMEGMSEGHHVSNAQLGNFLTQNISNASALAFIFAVMFSVPCFATVGAIYSETRSLLWSLGSLGYYTLLSFGWGILAYQVGLMLFQ
jgi:ferrous iron transport protein B